MEKCCTTLLFCFEILRHLRCRSSHCSLKQVLLASGVPVPSPRGQTRRPWDPAAAEGGVSVSAVGTGGPAPAEVWALCKEAERRAGRRWAETAL